MKIKKMKKRLYTAMDLLDGTINENNNILDYVTNEDIEKTIKAVKAAIGLIEAYDDLKNKNDE